MSGTSLIYRKILSFLPLLLGGYASLASEAKKDEFRGVQKIEEQVKDSEKVDREMLELGANLLQAFCDKDYKAALRLKAALALGRLRYLPAIPKLIDEISFTDPYNISSEPPKIEEEYPSIRALAYYGVAAVPNVVEAIAREKDGATRARLWFVIHLGKTSELAITYAKGMEAETTEEEAKRRIRDLIESLKKFEAERRRAGKK